MTTVRKLPVLGALAAALGLLVACGGEEKAQPSGHPMTPVQGTRPSMG